MRVSIIILLFYPFLTLSQAITIKPLSDAINTYGAEFNFIQIDENKAYYTSSSLEDENFQSVIFSTLFKDGIWQKGKYTDLGKFYSYANINFPKNEQFFYFSICDKEGNCEIAYRNYKDQITQSLNASINLINSTNTQPHVVLHNRQKVMYFVSDRKGGFGGMDIWLSIIDKNGNFGVPINAGLRINSIFDEITPFFNEFEGELYFSSNRVNGLGGFDIYKSKGKLNLLGKLTNITKLNSKKDEMYLTFYNEKKGYFSSNRSEALYNKGEFCCNDIFSFELEPQEVIQTLNIHPVAKYLPLNLYFHNDEPDSHTMSISTEKTYQETYISYCKMEDDYFKSNPNLESFFKDSLKGNFNKLSIIFSYILPDLIEGKKIELQIKGHASPLHESQYNINLSKRRISSFINYVLLYENKAFSPYLENGSFKIVELPFGESQSIMKVSDNPNDRLNSIYSMDAILERRIEIIDVKLID